MSSEAADTDDRDETADLLRESMDFVDNDRGIDKHTIMVYAGIHGDAIRCATLVHDTDNDLPQFRRIRRLVDYEFATRATFSLSRIPTEADWDRAWVPECLAFEGIPVMIRAMGSVVGIDVTGRGEKEEGICVRLELVRGEDHEAFVDLIRKADTRKGEHNFLSFVPTVNVRCSEVPRAHAPLPPRKGAREGTCAYCHIVTELTRWPKPFDAIYDATKSLRPRPIMTKIALNDVREGDVVLAECVCERRSVAGGWTANFDLISITTVAQRSR